ncbi:microtubule-associated protein [Scheffersomyces coipomensis]|uniref:microtubule-associated protein n=1 Tax=Scheffersomyces coipomensis TaxID=1788519 RepID=UPI00315CD817
MSTSENIEPASENGSSGGSSTNPGSRFNLEKIRDIIETKKTAYLKGVANTDVDWFLRDSSISTSSPKLSPADVIDNDDSKLKLNDTGNHSKNNNINNNEGSPVRKQISNSSISPVSSHLTAGISNTNDHNSSKTKPSIAPIQEENIESASSPTSSPPQMIRKSRLSVSSLTGAPSNSPPSSGLFSKLKGRLGHSSSSSSRALSPPSSPKLASVNTIPPVFKSNYAMNNNDVKKPAPQSAPVSLSNSTATTTTTYAPTPTHTENNHDNNIDHYKLTRTTSSPASDSDPRLDEYIKFYQQKDIRRSSVSSRRSSAVSTNSGQSHNNNILNQPSASTLPSVLINYDDVQSNYCPNSSKPEAPVESTSAKLSSLFRRKSITSSPNPNFKDLKPLKRVAFHSSTFLIDPPQQIPSRNPRKGNVEVLGNGTIKIHQLSDEDRIAMEKSQLGQGGGIVVGGTGALGLIKKPEDSMSSVDLATTTSVRDSNGEEDTAIDKHARSLGVEKPMITHQRHSYDVPVKKMALDLMYTRCCHLREILPIPAIVKQIPKGSMAPLPVLQLRNPTPTMVEIQTFADFIRIAPIICVSLDGVSLSIDQLKILLSAMSAKKQLEKISLRNTPIDREGWALLCWFLSRNTVLNRLDITQCPALSVNVLKKRKKKLDNKKYEEEVKRMSCNRENRSDMDWSLFVATLVARGGIEELILTGCCITDLEVFDKLMKLAVSKNTNRLGLAYNQLTPKHFKIIVDTWLFQDFARGIDLGYNDFSSSQFTKILLDYKRLTKNFDDVISKSSIGFVSLNSTNITFSEQFKEVFETIFMRLPNLKYLDFSNNQRLFGTFSKPNTNNTSFTIINPDISVEKSDSIDSDATTTDSSSSSENSATRDLGLSESAIALYFTSKFPLMPKLIRLHLENNNFSNSSLMSIAKVIPFCKNLGYLSLLGNHIDVSSASALINGLKNSKTLITLDCDLENFPDLFKERIGLYTMRNMERLLYANKKSELSLSDTTTISDEVKSESLAEQLNHILLAKAKSQIDLKSPEISKFILRAQNIRRELRNTIDELLKLQLKNELDLDGKETLIRFIFIDSSIEKGLQLIDPSLIETDKNTPASFISGAEDEKKLTKITSEFNDDQNTLAVPQSQDIRPSASPLSMSRSTSRTNLNNLDRQEGSVLKLSKLHDFHHIHSNSLDDMSGEDMRKKLKSIEFTDLDKIIGYLGRLKEQGISLEKVFNNQGKDFNKQFQKEEIFIGRGENLNEAYDKVLSNISTYKME